MNKKRKDKNRLIHMNKSIKKFSINEDELHLLIFIVSLLTEKYNKPAYMIYEVLNKTNIINEYIIGCYDVVCSLSQSAMIEDVEGYLKHRGIKIG